MKYENAAELFYERLGLGEDFSLERRRRDVLHDVKWKIFMRQARLFRYVPFVDFVLGSGSMALGNVHDTSDFDVLVGTRTGRIFTARFFSVLCTAFLGIRRKKSTSHGHAADKICLNHFITEGSLCLAPPHNIYWQELYRNLVPLYGSSDSFRKFWDANGAWMHGSPRFTRDDTRYRLYTPSFIKKICEFSLSGIVGDLLEASLKKIQLMRIERGMKSQELGYAPRMRYSDAELEFHPDTKRIEVLTEGIRIPEKAGV